jgi:hypothetical protein
VEKRKRRSYKHCKDRGMVVQERKKERERKANKKETGIRYRCKGGEKEA